MKQFIHILLFSINIFSLQAQTDVLPKVKHAEPLYMDLIRDLGARRGERELNVGGGLQRSNQYNSYSGFIEYEFAPFNRLGMEVEIPLQFYQPQSLDGNHNSIPKNRIEGLKFSTQYTFLVAPQKQISMAVGYTNQFIFHSFKTLHNENKLAKGNLYSPLFIAAKKWGNNIHTMLITGPLYEQRFSSASNSLGYQFHASIFHTFLKSNFVGFEINHVYLNESYSTVIHPQVKFKICPAMAIGIVTAIPLDSGYEPSVFFRFIYEPKRN
jgi:hypothetical protein